MWEFINKIDLADGVWKLAFLATAGILVYAIYHAVKFFGNRFLKIMDRLTDISDKMDRRITLVEQEQKFQNDRLMKHDEHIDMLMQALIKATKR